jgi:hypothetical protein
MVQGVSVEAGGNQIMNSRSTRETIRLVPHSGIQFLTFGFDLESTPPFAHPFIGHKVVAQAEADGTVPMELLPGWNEDEADGEPPYVADSVDDNYRGTKDKAVSLFLNRWIPVPFLAVRPGLDRKGHEILDSGPIDWARLRLSPAEPGAKLNGKPISHYAVFAFDTEILDPEKNLYYVAPTPENVRAEQEFVLASRFANISSFLASGSSEKENENVRPTSWVDRWLFGAYVAWREASSGRRMSEEQKKTVEHLAQYVTLIQFLGQAISIPRIRLIDTFSDGRRTAPVAVDLVLDIGNSRTCGVLIETYPNDSRTSFANTAVLGLRNLSEPHRVYDQPFESHVEFAQARFGSERLAKEVRSSSAFFWPSPVRVGPEAAAFRELGDGTEGTSGMSGPKRYLCDLNPVQQDWQFQRNDADDPQSLPLVALRLYPRVVTARGDVKRQVLQDKELYNKLAAGIRQSDGGALERGFKFSRSSIFTFMLCEIVAQAWSMVNNPQFRKTKREADSPRVLRRIFLSLPTAMPVQEQRIMRSRAQAAVKMMWDLMNWSEVPPKNVKEPEVEISQDEATCAQLVYLYNEIAEKFSGNINDFFDLMGKPRPIYDPELRGPPKVKVDPGRSLRIASVDIGGGTTDLMVTTYHVEGGTALVPIQNFREGFRIAGDEVLREAIQQTILQPLAAYLRQNGIASPQNFLHDRFGSNSTMVQDAQLRREFVLRVLQPAALGVLRAAEVADFASEEHIETTTLGALLGKSADLYGEVIPARVRNYLEDEARKWGAQPFSLTDCPIPLDMKRVRAAVASVLGEVFDNIAEAINHLDCDVVILSGRPSRLPATIDLFVDKLAVAPDRVVPLSRYQVGKWYPFASRSGFRIDDPKTATVVGCLLGVLVERQLNNFAIKVGRVRMRSTAKYIGALENTGQLFDNKVFFRWSDDPKIARQDSATIAYYAQMRLGYRQLPIERWTATPLYRLKADTERAKTPISIELIRTPPGDIPDVDDSEFVKSEAADLEFAKNEALKEVLSISFAQDADNNSGVERTISLSLETLPSEDAYWLDTGILTVS